MKPLGGERQSHVYKGYTQENLEQKQLLKSGGEKYVLFYRRKTGEKEWWGRISFQMAGYLLNRNLKILATFLLHSFTENSELS